MRTFVISPAATVTLTQRSILFLYALLQLQEAQAPRELFSNDAMGVTQEQLDTALKRVPMNASEMWELQAAGVLWVTGSDNYRVRASWARAAVALASTGQAGPLPTLTSSLPPSDTP